MKNKMVIHFSKYKKSDIARLCNHNLRKSTFYKNENVDLSKSHRNSVYIYPENGDLKKDILSQVESRVSGRITKQSVFMVEGIISASSDFLKTLSPEREEEFFRQSLTYIQNVFGKENVRLAVTHRDETDNIHMHVSIVPIIDTPNSKGRLCAKELLSRDALLRIQEELPALLAKHHFQVERGQKGSTATHMKVEDFKRNAEKKKQEIIKDYNHLVDKYNALQDIIDDAEHELNEQVR